jgi:hypothetical protein
MKLQYMLMSLLLLLVGTHITCTTSEIQDKEISLEVDDEVDRLFCETDKLSIIKCIVRKIKRQCNRIEEKVDNLTDLVSTLTTERCCADAMLQEQLDEMFDLLCE